MVSRRSEIERIRGAYVALFPVEPEARRAELEALKRELDLDELEPHAGPEAAPGAEEQGTDYPLARPSWSLRLLQSDEKLEPHNRPRWCGSYPRSW